MNFIRILKTPKTYFATLLIVPMKAISFSGDDPSPGTGDAVAFFVLQIIIQIILLIIGIALAYGLLREKE